jgi:histidyl-tRNA synthetase
MKIQPIRGTHDLYGEELHKFTKIEKVVKYYFDTLETIFSAFLEICEILSSTVILTILSKILTKNTTGDYLDFGY